ncbi:MAG: hypothetical protein CMN30_05000 [Sandaracinus sp.]|nr:hypothetical protein [Sandaracinus sp.]
MRNLVVRIVAGVLAAAALAALGVHRDKTWPLVVAGLFLVLYLGLVMRRPLRRIRAVSRPFPPAWRKLLEENVGFYEELDAAGRKHFERNVALLVADHEFEPVEGVELDDELRVLSVAGAAVIFHHLGIEPRVRRTILLYPDHFDDAYDVSKHGEIMGMVHRQGPIVFSRRALRNGWNSKTDGSNVCIHEWAHVLDMDDGFADGIPVLAGDTEHWDEVLKEELERVRKGRSALRAYAGTNRAELFACAAEAFFERPGPLKKKDGELYELLCEAFGFDPLA